MHGSGNAGLASQNMLIQLRPLPRPFPFPLSLKQHMPPCGEQRAIIMLRACISNSMSYVPQSDQYVTSASFPWASHSDGGGTSLLAHEITHCSNNVIAPGTEARTCAGGLPVHMNIGKTNQITFAYIPISIYIYIYIRTCRGWRPICRKMASCSKELGLGHE